MKKRLFVILKCVLAAGIMGFLVYKVNTEHILHTFLHPAQPGWLVVAMVLLIPNLLIQWYRWHYLLALIQQDIRPFDSCASFLGGVAVGMITPGRLGEMGRPLFLKHIDRLQAFGLIMIDRVYAIFPVVIGGMWGMITIFCYQADWALYMLLPLVLLGAIVSLVIFLIALHPNSIRSFLYQVSILLPFREKLKHILLCFNRFQKREAQKYLFYSIIFYLIYIFQFSFLALAFRPVPWTKTLLASTSTMLAKAMLPISFGDFGIREGAAIFFFRLLNMEEVVAFNSALLLFGINVLIPTLAGVFFLPKLQINQEEKTATGK